MEVKEAINEIHAQPGPQTTFLSTPADIAFYGGAAGGGKTFGILLDILRHYDNPDFEGVIFRRETPMITNPGGLWAESSKLYTRFSAEPNQQRLEWRFPSRALIKFSHLQLESDVFNWQGAQVAYIGFDEVTHFSKEQFFYMLSRLRSTSGVPGHIRATCNPDPDSWVAEFISWWLDPDTGLPIYERAGVLRWFIRNEDEIIWADSREELIEAFGDKQLPKSVTFIPSSVYDNKILLDKDPSYLSNLMAQGAVDKARLLGGNWKVRKSAGKFFQRSKFEIVDNVPPNIIAKMRYWDRAATKPSPSNPNPDYTVGLKLYKCGNGNFYVAHVERFRDTPAQVQSAIKRMAALDGFDCHIGIEEDPGQAGIAEANIHITNLLGYVVRKFPARQDKVTRAMPASAAAEVGRIFIVRGSWNEAFLSELEAFDGEPPARGTKDNKSKKDDQVDALSGAFNALNGSKDYIGALSKM